MTKKKETKVEVETPQMEEQVTVKEPIAKIVGNKAHDKKLKQAIKSAQETVVILINLME